MHLEGCDDLAQDFRAAGVAGRVRRHDDVVGVGEQLTFLFKFVVTVDVNLEPLGGVERAQSHRHAPTLRFERDVREVLSAHRDLFSVEPRGTSK